VYHLYHTPAIVLGSAPSGEASKNVFLFTRELGFVSARAQGVRLARAKLRFHINDFSYVDAWLVRGRETWRLANAVSRANFFTKMRGNEGARKIMSRAALLLRKFVPPEETHQKLFDAIVSGFLVLLKTKDARELENVEILLALRILYHLGYIGEPKAFLPVVAETSFGAREFSLISPLRRELISVINSSLRSTGL
jgi:recombinational DNA repair protein (RecF pathway)